MERNRHITLHTQPGAWWTESLGFRQKLRREIRKLLLLAVYALYTFGCFNLSLCEGPRKSEELLSYVGSSLETRG